MADSGDNKQWPGFSYGPFDPKHVGITSESSLRDMQIEILAQVLKLQALQTCHNDLYTKLELKMEKLNELLVECQGVQAHHTKEFVEVCVKIESFKKQVRKLFDTMRKDMNKEDVASEESKGEEPKGEDNYINEILALERQEMEQSIQELIRKGMLTKETATRARLSADAINESANVKGFGKRKNVDEDPSAASEPAKRVKDEPVEEDLDVTQTLACEP